MPKVIKALHVHQDHLSNETWKNLQPENDEYGVTYSGESGLTLILGFGQGMIERAQKGEFPEDLRELMLFADEHGCSYVFLDEFGEIEEGLPWHD